MPDSSGACLARRWYWLQERSAEDSAAPGASGYWRERRLAELGASLPAWVPGRQSLLNAGVLCAEEVYGATATELQGYGLSSAEAERLVALFDEGAIAMTVFQTGPLAGQRYEQDAVSIVPSTTKTASYTSDTYELGDKGSAALDLVVSAISGTEAFLHVQIETRRDSDDSWRCVDAFLKRTTTGTSRRSFAGCDRYLRAVCTFSGTSVTFSVLGVAQ